MEIVPSSTLSVAQESDEADTTTGATPRPSDLPLIICFHGSGEPLPAWSQLVELLGQHYRVLLLDRGRDNPKPHQYAQLMSDHLEQNQFTGPYILLAHSYGGAFAKHFLRLRRRDVAGMILVEAGKGGASDEIDKYLKKTKYLDPQPISVIRGNSLIARWKTLTETPEHNMESAEAIIAERTTWLEKWDEEDEKMEREQLQLSRNQRYVHLPDCGHHIVRDRPEVVLVEVQWVLDNIGAISELPKWWQRVIRSVRGT